MLQYWIEMFLHRLNLHTWEKLFKKKRNKEVMKTVHQVTVKELGHVTLSLVYIHKILN